MLWFLYFGGVCVPRRSLYFGGVRVPHCFSLLCCGSCILVGFVFLVVLVCCVVVLVFWWGSCSSLVLVCCVVVLVFWWGSCSSSSVLFLYFGGVRVPRRFSLLCCGSCILVGFVFLVVLVCCVVVLVFWWGSCSSLF